MDEMEIDKDLYPEVAPRRLVLQKEVTTIQSWELYNAFIQLRIDADWLDDLSDRFTSLIIEKDNIVLGDSVVPLVNENGTTGAYVGPACFVVAPPIKAYILPVDIDEATIAVCAEASIIAVPPSILITPPSPSVSPDTPVLSDHLVDPSAFAQPTSVMASIPSMLLATAILVAAGVALLFSATKNAPPPKPKAPGPPPYYPVDPPIYFPDTAMPDEPKPPKPTAILAGGPKLSVMRLAKKVAPGLYGVRRMPGKLSVKELGAKMLFQMTLDDWDDARAKGGVIRVDLGYVRVSGATTRRR